MNNTLCKECYFAQPAHDSNACSFGIPDLIRDCHKVEVQDNYYKLQNYQCRYGFSKKIYQENIDKFIDIDLIEYIKQQNIVKYSLAIIIKEYTPQDVLFLLNKLSIKPYYITIVCYKDGNLFHKQFGQKDQQIKYKVHNFLEQIPPSQALHIALETNKNKIGNLLWILTEESLKYCIENDSIQNINYIINAKQKPAHYYRCNNINSLFDGIFINTDNYWNLSRTGDYTIEDNDKTLIVSYD